MPTYDFEAVLWRHDGDAAWYFVTVPSDVSDDIAARTAGTRRGFGSVRVRARTHAVQWETSVFPDSRSESYVLPVKRQVRDKAGIDDGDVVAVTLTLR